MKNVFNGLFSKIQVSAVKLNLVIKRNKNVRKTFYFGSF